MLRRSGQEQLEWRTGFERAVAQAVKAERHRHRCARVGCWGRFAVGPHAGSLSGTEMAAFAEALQGPEFRAVMAARKTR